MGEFSYPTIEKMVLDVTDDAGVADVVKSIVETEGKIDILVNNAGYFSAGSCPARAFYACLVFNYQARSHNRSEY